MRRAALVALAAAALLSRTTRPAGLLLQRADTPALPLRPGALDRLSKALTYETVAGNGRAFSDLHAFLRASFPAVFRALTLHTLDPGGGTPPTWLLEWEGAASLAAAPPGVLIGHLDVVPGWGEDGEEASSAGLGAPGPFSGHVSASPAGFITSRGALDAKGPALAMLEAVDALLSAGFTPGRTLFLCLGGDEETGGAGSRAAAAFVGGLPA